MLFPWQELEAQLTCRRQEADKEIQNLKEAAALKWQRATDFKVSASHAWLHVHLTVYPLKQSTWMSVH